MYTHHTGQHHTSRAFALPTVLIASVVLLMVLAASVTATTALRTTLKTQYYTQLAQVAGESGVAYAKACLAASGNVPQWTDAKPLMPSTDCSGNSALSPAVRAMVIAGGGSGANTGGGGGAGGFQDVSAVSIGQTSYPVTVGTGGVGTGGNGSNGLKGANSSFSSLTSVGGGYGATHGGSIGGSGGSGGGGGMVTGGPGGPGGVGSQGSNGGTGFLDSGWVGSSGGGGGAGSVGLDGGNSAGTGNGGNGAGSSITGSTVFYAGGGGSGEVNGNYVGTGGLGGGGSGALNAGGSNGVANSGSGGGGGSYNGSYFSGGVGGSGIVVISYPTSSGIVATGGTITTSGANKIHKFTSSGTFAVTSIGTTGCPTDVRCFVTVNGNIRSGFSVPKPVVDSNGRALTISNTGYVEITRASNGNVWRTYKQPSVQAAVVPDLCSGNATAVRGWSAAVKATTQDSLGSASAAQTITLAAGNVNAGVMYFRKDFSVNDAGNYDLNILTTSSQDVADAYIDSQTVVTSNGSLAAASLSLTPGCHTMFVRLTNATALARASDFTASLARSGNTVPIIVSDTTWRVATGDPEHFSSNTYFEAPNSWESDRVLGSYTDTTLPWSPSLTTNWQSISGDSQAAWIANNAAISGTDYPAQSYMWLRDAQPFTLAAVTDVRLSSFCDDVCDIYLDGALVTTTAYFAGGPTSKTITIQAGQHTFGARLKNGNQGPSAFLFAALNLANNTVIARSDAGWDTTNFWTTTDTDLNSYDNSYVPTPNPLSTANVKVLALGGGGGGANTGGGGGAGGFQEIGVVTITQTAYPVTVGAGGPSTTTSGGNGIRGQDSIFASVKALGGGYGGSHGNHYGGGGGSGGGGGISTGSTGGVAGVGVQGFNGGTGFAEPSWVGDSGGGGGAGSVGVNGGNSPGSGNGGSGKSSSITGSAVTYAGGGGAGEVSGSYTGSGGSGGGGSGLLNTAGTSGTANTGSGGGGGSYTGSYFIGGSGGSGIVVISYPTGSLTATGGTITTSGGNTIHRFTSSGVFTVVSIP